MGYSGSKLPPVMHLILHKEIIVENAVFQLAAEKLDTFIELFRGSGIQIQGHVVITQHIAGIKNIVQLKKSPLFGPNDDKRSQRC